MSCYAFAVQKLKNKNAALGYMLPDKAKAKWDFAIMPQNLYLNNKLVESNNLLNNRHTGMQPLFSASCTF